MAKYTLKNNIIYWLDKKINNGSCANCPCYGYERSYFDGDITEYCIDSTDIDFHWYCIMPDFVKEIVMKREIRKRDKYLEKLMQEDKE